MPSQNCVHSNPQLASYHKCFWKWHRMVSEIGEKRESKNNRAWTFLKEQPERDLAINGKNLHVNMQIPVCVYNMETKHLMRLNLIHLSLLYGHPLRGCWIKSHKSASDLDAHNITVLQRKITISYEETEQKFGFIFLLLTTLLKQ